MRLDNDDEVYLYINDGSSVFSAFAGEGNYAISFSYVFKANKQYDVTIHYKEFTGDGSLMLFWNIGDGMVSIAQEYFQYKEDYGDTKHILVTCQEGYKEVSGGSEPDRCDPL